MKTVKFIGNDPSQQFTKTLRKNVNAYFKEKGISTKGNWKMMIKALVMLSLYFVPFIILLTIPLSIGLAWVMVVIIGLGEAGIGMSVMHDASHGAFSEKKWVNTLFSYSMFILGSNTFNWKMQHNVLHHTFTNIYLFDQDIESKAAIRLCEHAPLYRFHRFQYLYAYFFYGLMTISKLFTDISQLIKFNRSGITKEQNLHPGKELLKLIIIKVIYFSIILGLPLWLTDYAWWQILIGFATLHITAGITMSTVFQMAHVVEGAAQPLPDKDGIIHDEWTVHQLKTTSDFGRYNSLINWYVGGLNFQIEHHLFPNICHLHYPKIAPIVERTAREFGVPYNQKSSFFAAFVSHAKRLKQLGNANRKEILSNDSFKTNYVT